MTADAPDDRPPAGSLIQQRIRLARERVIGVLFVVLGLLGLVAGVGLIAVDPSKWSGWAMCVAWLIFVGVGAVRLARYRRSVAAFEDRNGSGAGEQ
jgi:hypothetical protein